MNKKFLVMALILLPQSLCSMHIMEGFLPFNWAVIWWAVTIPFLFISFRRIKILIADKPYLKMLIVLAGAFAFVLSALKLPSVTGSSSHPTGVGLGTLMFGPFTMGALGLIVLLFQALLLAHGGLTTLGANLFSMGVAGPLMAYAAYRVSKKIIRNRSASIFIAAFTGDLFTYVVTSFQLSLAYPDPAGGAAVSLTKFLGIFAITQIPIAVSEGLVTLLMMNILSRYAINEMKNLEELRA